MSGFRDWQARGTRPSFTVESSDGRSFALVGIVDENADFSFFARLSGRVRLNVRDVRRINSFGVRAWIEALRTIPAGTAYEFVECASPILDQLLTVHGFQGRGSVGSFFAPMLCNACGREASQLLETEDVVRNSGRIPEGTCECGRPMALDDLEERYWPLVRR